MLGHFLTQRANHFCIMRDVARKAEVEPPLVTDRLAEIYAVATAAVSRLVDACLKPAEAGQQATVHTEETAGLLSGVALMVEWTQAVSLVIVCRDAQMIFHSHSGVWSRGSQLLSPDK